jgi:hypothetical protein
MVVISENLPFKVRGESAEDRGKATCQDCLARPNEHAAISAHRARFVYLRLSIGAPTQCQSGAAQHGDLERIEPYPWRWPPACLARWLVAVLARVSGE